MAKTEGSNRQVVGIAEQLAADRRGQDAVQLLRQLSASLDRHNVLTYATAIAFRVLFALAFLSLTGLAFAGVVHLDSIWRHQLGPGIARVVSRNFYSELDHSVDQVLTTRRWWWLSIGLVLTLWQVSSGVRALMSALDSIYEVDDRRPFWERMGLSLLLALVVCLALLTIAGITFLFWSGPWPLSVARVALIGLILLALVAVLLRFTTPSHLEVRWVTLGSTLSILTWLLTTWAFGWYIANFAFKAYQQAFGVLSLLVVVMTYLYIASVAFLIGAEIDALVVSEASTPKSSRPGSKRARGSRAKKR